MGKFIDFNWKWLQKLYAAMYVPVKNQADKHIATFGRWEIKVRLGWMLIRGN